MHETTQAAPEPTLQDYIKSLDGLPTGAKVNGLQAICLMLAEAVDPERLDGLTDRIEALEKDLGTEEQPAEPAPAPAPAA